MSQGRGPTGPQFHADRPREQEAVRTTIVGGRPPGSGQSIGNIPRGIEVLIKKAVVDPEFRELLLDRRAEAADAIGLPLEPAEAMMLAAAPREQLEAVIAQTNVPEEHRRVFLGKAAAAMLAMLGLATVSCKHGTKGVRPDGPVKEKDAPPRKSDSSQGESRTPPPEPTESPKIEMPESTQGAAHGHADPKGD